MEQLNMYLKKYFNENYNENEIQQDLKIKQFCQLFHDFELKITYYQDEIEELKLKHKKELHEVLSFFNLIAFSLTYTNNT